jgi:hypothetical protein
VDGIRNGSQLDWTDHYGNTNGTYFIRPYKTLNHLSKQLNRPNSFVKVTSETYGCGNCRNKLANYS